MKTNKKYIIPLALLKLVLFYLVLQFFFSSCESEDLYYSGELYSEGALVEIPATFGVEDQVYTVGDTIFLEIALENTNLENQLTGNTVNLADALFNVEFGFADEKGNAYKPYRFTTNGEQLSFNNEDSTYNSSFGYSASLKSAPLSNVNSDMPYLRIGVVFYNAGEYTIYFVNTPNNYTESGEVDVHYQHDENGDAQAFAYAIYSFGDRGRTQNYGTGSAQKEAILHAASMDQAIIDFKVVSEKK